MGHNAPKGRKWNMAFKCICVWCSFNNGVVLSAYCLVHGNSLWWKGWDPINWFNHTSWVAVVTPTDGPKSDRNCCVIKVFGGFLCCQVVIGPSQISSFFSWICVMIISNGSIRHTATCVGAQRGESFALFQFLLSRLRKVSYLTVSVPLTVKQVRVNECVVQYDWSMIFKGPIKWCNT